MFKQMVLVLLSAAVLAGCSSSPVEEDFGKSVAQAISSQAVVPPTTPSKFPPVVEGADPDVINNAVTEMKTDVAKRDEVKQGVTINVGSNQRK